MIICEFFEGISNVLIIRLGDVVNNIESGLVAEDLTADIPREGSSFGMQSVSCKVRIQPLPGVLPVRPTPSTEGRQC